MVRQMSFTKYENQVLPNFRQKLNQAESTEDVKKFLFYTAKELFDSIFEGSLTLDYEDISLVPDGEPVYRLSRRLKASETFRAVWEDSDLPHVMHRLAESARKRYKHLEKQPEKTDSKIRR